MAERLEGRRLAVFLAVAFGLAWVTAAVVSMTGGLAAGPTVVSGVPLSLVLVAGPYMFAPAIATVVTRRVTGEGWDDLLVRPRIRSAWRSYLVAWLAPVALVIAGAGVYFLVFPGQFGGTAAVGAALEEPGGPSSLTPEAFLVLQLGQLLLVVPLVNGAFAFGEEFGWRGYLLPKLLPLGVRRALIAHGAVWGVWHWPIIAMGHNYGVAYPGAPGLGFLVMVPFTVAVGVVLGWPAVLGHAMVNGAGGLGLLFVVGDPALLLGPTAAGLLGTLPWMAVAAWLLLGASRLAPADTFSR